MPISVLFSAALVAANRKTTIEEGDVSMLTVLTNAALGLYGLFFTTTALLKLSRHGHMVDEFRDLKLPYPLALVSGLFEIVCGPALIVGIWNPVVAGFAALIMIPVMTGASIVNFTRRNSRMGIGVVVLFLVPICALAFAHWPNILALL